MAEIDAERRCPKCTFLGRYTATSGFRGAGAGDPLIIWNMVMCGHQFTSDHYYRFDHGWRMWMPGERDERACD